MVWSSCVWLGVLMKIVIVFSSGFPTSIFYSSPKGSATGVTRTNRKAVPSSALSIHKSQKVTLSVLSCGRTCENWKWCAAALSAAGSNIVSKHTVAAPDWLPPACVTTWRLAEPHLIWACAQVCYGCQAWRVSTTSTNISWLEMTQQAGRLFEYKPLTTLQCII